MTRYLRYKIYVDIDEEEYEEDAKIRDNRSIYTYKAVTRIIFFPLVGRPLREIHNSRNSLTYVE